MGDETAWIRRQAEGVLRLLDDCGLDVEEVEWVTRRRQVRLVLDLEPRSAGAEQAQREFEALDSDEVRRDVLRLAADLHERRTSPV